jgi:biotin transport system substrate-specific component
MMNVRTIVGSATIDAPRSVIWARNVLLVVSASLFVAASARVVALIDSPVPISLVNFAVLLVGLILGPRLGAAALALYLIEGAAGLPFFAPTGPGGVAQLFGPTGGFLLAYPAVAAVAGSGFKQLGSTFRAGLIACLAAELVLFASGAFWLKILSAASFGAVVQMAIVPFIPGEVLKIFAASALAIRWRRFRGRGQRP